MKFVLGIFLGQHCFVYTYVSCVKDIYSDEVGLRDKNRLHFVGHPQRRVAWAVLYV